MPSAAPLTASSIPPTPGASLESTVDAALQHVVERELSRGVAEHRADSGVAIVIDPWTGEVLAMASVPTFNPNAFGDADANHRRNLGVGPHLRAGLDVQDVHRLGGPPGTPSDAGIADRLCAGSS